MSDEKPQSEPTLVEKWVRDQQEWQKMAMEYFDSMVKNDEFLIHLGNAMRGSLLAGKHYPGTEPPEGEDDAAAAADDDRIDLVLHALHLLQGDVADLKVAVENLARKVSATGQEANSASEPRVATSREGMPPHPVPVDLNRGEG